MITIRRTDRKNLTAEESGIGRECKNRKFKTINKAISFVRTLPEEGLYKGVYCMYGPYFELNLRGLILWPF